MRVGVFLLGGIGDRLCEQLMELGMSEAEFWASAERGKCEPKSGTLIQVLRALQSLCEHKRG